MSLNKHKDLKEALRLFDVTITDFASSLQKPTGEIGVSHTAVIQVAQGVHSTEWIQNAIEKVIQEAHTEFPEYYSRKKNRVA